MGLQKKNGINIIDQWKNMRIAESPDYQNNIQQAWSVSSLVVSVCDIDITLVFSFLLWLCLIIFPRHDIISNNSSLKRSPLNT